MQPVEHVEFETIAAGFEFVEAPRISPDGTVWFSDLTGGGYYRKRPGEGVKAVLPERIWIGGAALDCSGQILCGGRGGLIAVDPETGATQEILSSIEGRPIIAINDMEPDGSGGLYVGTIDFVSIMAKGEPPAPGILFHLSPQREVTIIRRDVHASNGIGLSPRGRWLYHSETGRGVWRYQLDLEGRAGSPELIAEMKDSDGLAIDSEGGVWVACWESSRLLYLSADGETQRELGLPFPHLVSVAFGGQDLRKLYVTTGGNADNVGKGAVVCIDVDVPGQSERFSQLSGLEKSK